MRDVLSMAPYFISHARAVFDLMGADAEGRLTPVRDLLAWLRGREDRAAPFSARDAWQALKGRRWAKDGMEAMTAALNELEDLGWTDLIPPPEVPGKRGRKPSPRYAVHPYVASPEPARAPSTTTRPLEEGTQP